jgi:hypothetical protein
VRLELSEHLLLDLDRAGLLWTGAQHEDRRRPLDPRAVRWMERSGYRPRETTMDRDDNLSEQWNTDQARAGDALARVIRERDEARAAIGQMQDTARNAGIDAVHEYLPDFDGSRIDGGCTDGSEYDLTAAEVKQCVRAVGEELDEARAALAAERAAVVAWLRSRAVDAKDHAMTINAAYGDRDEWAGAWAALDECTAIADAIERGEHLSGGEGGR